MKVSSSYAISRVGQMLCYNSPFFFRVQRFLLSKIRGPLYRLNRKCRAITKLSMQAQAEAFGVKLSVDTFDIKGFSLWLEGSGQFEKIDYFVDVSKACGGGQAFVDIGSNYGEFLSVLAQAPGIHQAIFVEPNPRVFSCLERAASQLDLPSLDKSNFTLLNAAVVEPGAPSTVDLHFSSEYSGGGSILETFSQKNTQKTRVKTVSTDELIDRVLQLEKRPSMVLIKIDIEGYELQILGPLLKRLEDEKLHYTVMFEIHYQSQNLETKKTLTGLLERAPKSCIVYPVSKRGSEPTVKIDALTSGQYDLALIG